VGLVDEIIPFFLFVFVGKLHVIPMNFYCFCNHPLMLRKSQFSVSNFKKFAISPIPLDLGLN
jgi:hypothetical protein